MSATQRYTQTTGLSRGVPVCLLFFFVVRILRFVFRCFLNLDLVFGGNQKNTLKQQNGIDFTSVLANFGSGVAIIINAIAITRLHNTQSLHSYTIIRDQVNICK